MTTKSEFERAYIKYAPDKYELYFIKNFSISSLHIKPIHAITLSLGVMIPFIFALIAYNTSWPHAIKHIPSFIYAAFLAFTGLYGLFIWYKRHKRIKNICNELNIDYKIFQEIVKKYYYEKYYPDIKDYINNVLLEDD